MQDLILLKDIKKQFALFARMDSKKSKLITSPQNKEMSVLMDLPFNQLFQRPYTTSHMMVPQASTDKLEAVTKASSNLSIKTLQTTVFSSQNQHAFSFRKTALQTTKEAMLSFKTLILIKSPQPTRSGKVTMSSFV